MCGSCPRVRSLSVRVLLLAGVAGCGSTPTGAEPTVGAEVLQLGLVLSATDLRPADQLVVRLYATNPSTFPAVVRIDCRHYGLGLRLRLPGGVYEDVSTGIPPCKVPSFPPTLRVAAGTTDSLGYGWAGFAAGYPAGEYQLQVIYRTLDTTLAGPAASLRFLSP